MKKLFKPNLYAMRAYQPPLEGRSASQHLLLDFNERTIPVSEAICKALCDYINSGALQKYPAYGDITTKLADYLGTKAENLMITNGSDQGIDLVVRAVAQPGWRAIIPAPSFAIYRQCAEVENAEIVEPDYDIEGGFPLNAVLAAVNDDTRLIVVPNPNNPTGTGISTAQIEEILTSAPEAVVLIDECYFEYSGVTMVDMVDRYPNLVIARTFSKTWGLPSLRIGTLVSQPENIEQLLKIRGPYDVNQLAIVAVEAALENPDYTRDYVAEVMNESRPLLERWLDAHGVEYWPSEANFLWTFPDRAKELDSFLQQRNILVRPKADASGRLGLRINLGTVEQTKKLLTALDNFYQA